MSEPFVKDQAHRERIEKGEAILPSYPVTASPMSLEKPDGWIVKNTFGAIELFLHHERAIDAFNAWGSFIGPVFQRAQIPTPAQGVQQPRLADRLADVVMMLDAPDAYNREYIAAVCRSILSSLPSTLRQCPICARRVASPCETLAIATSCPLSSTMRGSGWRSDCPACVASKLTCDEHYSASPMPPAKRGTP